MITIIAIGKKHDANLAAAIADYEKRLRPPFDVRWIQLPYSAKSDDAARDDESARILSRIAPDDTVLLFDERGRQMTSERFSQTISARPLTIVIGGAYGVNDVLRNRADLTVSFSQMVLPHQLVRLILIEQVYRGQSIANQHPYHHV